MKRFVWSQDAIDLLMKLRGEGKSFTEIARVMALLYKEATPGTMKCLYYRVHKKNEEMGLKPKGKGEKKPDKAPTATKPKRVKREKDSRPLPEPMEMAPKPLTQRKKPVSPKLPETGVHDLPRTAKPRTNPHLPKPPKPLFDRELPRPPRPAFNPEPVKPITTKDVEAVRPVVESKAKPVPQWPVTGTKVSIPARLCTAIKDMEKVLSKVEDLLGESYDRTNPVHVMAILTVGANHARRDLRQTAWLTITPFIFVERVFGWLDAEYIWPVTDKTSTDMSAQEFERFAAICEENFWLMEREAI